MRSRIYPGDGDRRHGTVNGYGNLGCRCDRCRAAWATEATRLRTIRASRITPGDRRHGTKSFYLNHSCRCAECRAAHAAGQLARLERS